MRQGASGLLIYWFNPTHRGGIPSKRLAYGIGLNENTPDRPSINSPLAEDADRMHNPQLAPCGSLNNTSLSPGRAESIGRM